jgi:hypothetical protein
MLSQDLRRYVDLGRALGFKLRIQHSLLRNFVAFAETHGDDFVRTHRVVDWAARAPSPPSCRIRLLRFDASPSQCRLRIVARRRRQRKPWGARPSSAGSRTFTGRMR